MDKDTLYTAVLLALGDQPQYLGGFSEAIYESRQRWQEEFKRITGRDFEGCMFDFHRWCGDQEAKHGEPGG